ncbi:MAG: FAD:protein FMN transferase [Candidatus Thiodiazotropha lotti]|nr:FAD:protein FMN transferase [Candidatus Thiodiazotropha lotti]MCG7923446.1 FAD:protein FMN transferase [Candidatus Thiodiazotropha lotti]MCG7931260.1 FAD:protein FMN transferase [Candidatus Thiodiazotropha lotti]MCG8005165.1 FAD:protein FMN transferase [Candidatus Thiodiazotropha lotti]MCG8007000.1 FAD:protein FMN transferase [Candidatus Thiodiazotropha lotti]
MIRIALGLLLLWLLLPALSQAEWLSQQADIMGTRISVELWHEDTTLGELAITAVFDEFKRLDRKLSPYKSNSELSLVNRLAAESAIDISAELFYLLQESRKYAELTGGAFDITFASIGHQYDYRTGQKPDQQRTRQTLPLIDYRHIELDPKHNTVRFLRKGVKIDLGGIAKGYAVDRGIALLRERAIEHALISAGGDSRLIGDHRGRPWHIGIQAPRKKQAMAAVLPLTDSAVSTSGDYERFFETDGVRYHHIISPKTGHSAKDVQSVTILGANALRTDALSTSIFVLGAEAGLVLINRLDDVEAIIINQQRELLTSSGLDSLDKH